MSAGYRPGTVATLTPLCGAPFLAVRCLGDRAHPPYWCAPLGWPEGVNAEECGVRPLVVIDLEDHLRLALADIAEAFAEVAS